MITFEILEIKNRPFTDRISATDPRAWYSWKIREVGSRVESGSSFRYAEVSQLLKYFDVHDVSDLTGKTFESSKEDSVSALSYFILLIRHNGKYTPPTYQKVRGIAAEALADFKCPDYSDVDDDTVFQAFMEVWPTEDPDETWLMEFAEQIKSISGVILRKANQKNFGMSVLGPIAYLELIKGDKIQKLTMGPYSDPIEFVD